MPISYRKYPGTIQPLKPTDFFAEGMWDQWREQFPHLPANYSEALNPEILGGMRGRTVTITTREGKEVRRQILSMHPPYRDGKYKTATCMADLWHASQELGGGVCHGCRQKVVLLSRHAEYSDDAVIWRGMLCGVCEAKMMLGPTKMRPPALDMTVEEITAYCKDHPKT